MQVRFRLSPRAGALPVAVPGLAAATVDSGRRMIIGNGMLARAFSPYSRRDDVIIFASGVSNSREVSDENFDRETRLVQETAGRWPDLNFVYFSTCSILDPELNHTPYVRHKIAIEKRVGQQKHFHIFRLPLVIGKSENPNTLTNYFHHRLRRKQPLVVWEDAERNLIDVEDVYKIASLIIDGGLLKNRIANIAATTNIRVVDIVKLMAGITGEKPISKIEKGHQKSRYSIDVAPILPLIEQAGIDFENNYHLSVLRKYYEPSSAAAN